MAAEGCPGDGGADPAGVEHPGGGAVDGEFGAQGPAELFDAGLCDGVGGVGHAVDVGVDRGGDQYVPARRDDVRQRGAHGAPDSQQVHFDDAFERRLVDGGHRRGRIGCDARVGEDDIEAAEPASGAVHRAGQRGGVGDIRRQGQCPVAAELAGEGRCGAGAQVGDRHVGSACLQRAGGGRADASGGAGDQDGLARDRVGGHAVSLLGRSSDRGFTGWLVRCRRGRAAPGRRAGP